ncbi:hypothetical protein B6R96_23580 [Streptomyces sp. Sge12]|uniref:hypothetical protein n=1 Tax=Streptomyces sp. Sge12 TaxID=1972846 RepID=UPI0009C1B6E0|nr:hypothetical protein [Streptomyces sp. Sge12]ARE76559.1 hypothetical protein B6R96_23580 [Streptomyces sp. Sge12]
MRTPFQAGSAVSDSAQAGAAADVGLAEEPADGPEVLQGLWCEGPPLRHALGQVEDEVGVVGDRNALHPVLNGPGQLIRGIGGEDCHQPRDPALPAVGVVVHAGPR